MSEIVVSLIRSERDVSVFTFKDKMSRSLLLPYVDYLVETSVLNDIN